jgi:CHASE1-domain containing sensor protein
MNAELLYDPPTHAELHAPGGDVHRIWQRTAFWPVLVLVASLIVTAAVWRNARLDAVTELQGSFEHQAYDLKSSLESHLDAHAFVLKGFEGLFNASSEVTRKEFRRYFETMQLGTQDSGFTGISFHRIVTPEQLPAHLASVRQEGFPEYHLQL